MAKTSLKQIAYQKIKEKIINSEYASNSFMNEEFLCNDLQMSRTPVRDALGRLEQENLISIIPKKGFFILPLSIEEINMIYEGRILLESYIIRNYCQHLSEDSLRQLEEILTVREDTDYFRMDDLFHEEIIHQSKNRYLLQLHNSLRDQNRRLRLLIGRSVTERIQQTYKEHMEIYNKLLSYDAEEAARLMENHIRSARESTFRYFSSI